MTLNILIQAFHFRIYNEGKKDWLLGQATCNSRVGPLMSLEKAKTSLWKALPELPKQKDKKAKRQNDKKTEIQKDKKTQR